MTPNSSWMAISGRSSGSVMWRKRRHGPAPSIAAASSSSGGIACRPARKISIANGSPRQTLGMMIAHSEFSPDSQTGRSPSSPM